MVKVSIVVPIYNVEKYLPQCMESILNQTLKDIEIICVDDGSTDGCPNLLKEYQQKDNRIKIITKDNTGYGDSMNKGFEAATGEYIGIVESDDFIEPDMFAKLYNTARKNKADVVKSNFWFYWSNPERNELHEYFQKKECNSIIIPSKFNNGSLFGRKPSIWSAIYKRSFIEENGISFLPTPGASYQDTSFTFKVYSRAKRMVCLYDAFLHYRQDNMNSSVNNVDKKMNCVLDEYKEIEKFIAGNSSESKVLYPIYGAAFYDSCIWMYEKLSIKKRYEFLVTVSPWFKRLIKKIGLTNFNFGNCWWKRRDISRIANDPYEYHLWRNVERYEQNGCEFENKLVSTPLNNFESVKKSREKTDISPLISVIVPVYNCEKYLQSCLESLLFQDFKDFEVICVNDGSTDRSLSIIEEYAALDKRFVVINKENSGPSDARNIGLELAAGKYIMFLDSDDYYSQNTFKRIRKELIKSKKPDAIIFGTELFPDNPRASDWHYAVLTTRDEYYDKIDEKTMLTVPYLKVYSWRCCFKRSFINENNLRFNTEFKYGEDAIFMFEAVPRLRGISVISDKLYHYRHFNSESLMNTVVKMPVEFTNQQLRILDKLLQVGKENNIVPTKELFEFCCDFIFPAIDSCSGPDRVKAIKSFVKILKASHIDSYYDQASENSKGFYLYCVREEKNNRLIKVMWFKFKRGMWPKFKRWMYRFVPPSRKTFYEHSDSIHRRLDGQQQSIGFLQQQNGLLQQHLTWIIDSSNKQAELINQLISEVKTLSAKED